MQIQIYNDKTIGAEINSANAREIFQFLNSEQEYANWIKNRISHYDFIENQDYIIELVYTKGRPRKEYYVTLDMAKELCMVENNEKGRQARRYFIECEKRLKNLEQEKMQKLAFHQSLGYKSQLKQQKEKYENKIKALKYDLEKKKQLSFKRKLSEKELLDLRKILAKDYDILCFKKWEYMLFAESVSGKNYKLEKENDFCIYKSIKDSFNSKLDYYKNYEEYEEKWRKILRK
ncbi:TPA: antA/AntB antirepressor family protein [Campylobacter jejuni]|uniref:antA/AntB antirepressor family protein n=1 Tax=Campylobacter TaxID=194 RepID=UPI00069C8D06|nr:MULTISPECIES: antA/AntB antirepressor family protein [Campylobacter]EAK7935283.1 phage antirepressor Ant [Campylobacter jejuni]EAL0184792.1 phage antirepressor Ant [Campylobacter jejuni]ECK7434306.1 phage antirepressor Ant [Campylobacter jejuni]ECK7719196.1 phage antirepressor Ant [Campylobacter jejuni]ECK7772232.1 phage antirepressor Ant [Campylobacter jejuni]